MTKLCRCACCEGPLEPAQQLRFLVETDNLDNPQYLARIRRMPAVNGKPVPVCSACHAMLEANAITPAPAKPQEVPRPAKRLRVPNFFGILGAMTVGLFVGSLLSTRG